MIVNLEDDDGPANVLGIGWHLVTVKSCKEVESKKSTPGIEYALECAKGSIRKTFWITPDSKYRLKNFAQCCGYKGSLRTMDTKVLLGAKVQVEVQKGEPNAQGKSYNEVVNYMPPSASAPVADESDESFA